MRRLRHSCASNGVGGVKSGLVGGGERPLKWAVGAGLLPGTAKTAVQKQSNKVPIAYPFGENTKQTIACK